MPRKKPILYLGVVAVVVTGVLSTLIYNVNSNEGSGTQFFFQQGHRQSINMEVTSQLEDNSLEVKKYELSYDVPFTTTLGYKVEQGLDVTVPSIIEIAGENFTLEVNMMFPPDLATWNREYSVDDFPYVDVTNSPSKVIRASEVSGQIPDTYGYYTVVNQYYGTDIYCDRSDCPQSERISFREGIEIDNFEGKFYLFPKCASTSEAGIVSCDEIMKSLNVS